MICVNLHYGGFRQNPVILKSIQANEMPKSWQRQHAQLLQLILYLRAACAKLRHPFLAEEPSLLTAKGHSLWQRNISFPFPDYINMDQEFFLLQCQSNNLCVRLDTGLHMSGCQLGYCAVQYIQTKMCSCVYIYIYIYTA